MTRTMIYPTLYKGTKIRGGQKCGTLTATYSFGVAGFDFRPFVLELYEKDKHKVPAETL
jgi:hypothetical protein